MIVGADKSHESQVDDSELKHAAELWLPLTPNTITASELREPSGIIPLAYTTFDPLEDMIPGSDGTDNLDYVKSGLVVVQLHTKDASVLKQLSQDYDFVLLGHVGEEAWLVRLCDAINFDDLLLDDNVRWAGSMLPSWRLSPALDGTQDYFSLVVSPDLESDEFSKLVSDLQKSDLIIIAGRPSMGKTAFAMNIAQDIVFKQKKKVGFFSLEMSAQSIALRMLSSLSSVSQQKIRTGDYEASSKDTKNVTSAIEMMNDNDCHFYIDDTAAISPMDLRSKARRMKRETGLDMIIVDYLQLMSIPQYSENRVNEIAEVTRSLKAIAKELDLPVIALSQLNRGVETRNDKRPFLSDLRESGSIEQDADLIVFLYREEVYDKNTDQKNIAEIRVEKHRNGPTGLVKLTFVPHCTRFEDYFPQVYDGVGQY